MLAYTISWALLCPTLSAIFFGITLHTSNQNRRYWLLLPLIIFPILSLNSARDLGLPIGIRTLWTHGVLLYMLHATSLLFIEKWPSPIPSNGLSLWHFKVSTTLRLWTNFRMIERQKPSQKKTIQSQSRLAFILLQTLKLTIYYYLHITLIPTFTQATLGTIESKDLAVSKLHLFNFTNLTLRDSAIRTYFSLYWIWESFIHLDSFHTIFSITSVAAGIDQPSSCDTPLFGSPHQATSIRTFWSKFWHRLIARSGSNYGRLVATNILKLQPGSQIHDPVVAFVAFGISGLIHSFVAWQHHSKSWDRDVWWFLVNFVVGGLEKTVMTCVRGVAKRFGVSRELRRLEESWFGCLFGYVWVLGFFWWSVPFWQYPRLEERALRLEWWNGYAERLRAIKERREAAA